MVVRPAQHQGRFAEAAAGRHDRDTGTAVEQLVQGLELGGAADEAADGRRELPHERLADGDPGQRGVAGQDLAVQLLQLGTGVDAELVGQDGADVGEGLEGFGLAAGAVEGGDELGPEPLPQRMAEGEVAQLADGGGVAGQVEFDVDVQLDGGQQLLGQARGEFPAQGL